MPSASEVDLLHASHAPERHPEKPHRIARRMEPIEGIFVRVQSYRPIRVVRFGRLLAHYNDDSPRDDGKRPEAPGLVGQDRTVPIGDRKVELNSLRPSNWDAQPAHLPVEPVRLVLHLQHGFPHEGNRSSLPLSDAPPMRLQNGQGDLEGRRDVLSVHCVAGPQVRVRGPCESRARSEIVPQGDSDRLVHEEAELLEEPTQARIVPRDGEDQGPVSEHAIAVGKRWASTSQGEMPECENPDSGGRRKGLPVRVEVHH